MDKILKISWDDFEKYVNRLVLKIPKRKYKSLISIARGGLVLTGCLAYQLGIKEIHAINSTVYEGKEKKYTNNKMYYTDKDMLIVDDLVDTGYTLSSLFAVSVETACLFKKENSLITPTYFVEEIPSDLWLIFPWEKE